MATTFTRFDEERVRAELGTKLQRNGYTYTYGRNPHFVMDQIRWIYEYDDGLGTTVYILLGKYGDRSMVSFQTRRMDGRTVMFFFTEGLMTALNDKGSDLNRYAKRMSGGTMEAAALVQLFIDASCKELIRPRSS